MVGDDLIVQDILCICTLNNSFAPALVCSVVILLTDLIKENDPDLKNQSLIICYLCIAQSALFMFGLFTPRNGNKGNFKPVWWMKIVPWFCNLTLIISTSIFPWVIALSIFQAYVLIDDFYIIASLMMFTLYVEIGIFFSYC